MCRSDPQVAPLGELLDDRRAERRQVVRAAARHETVVDDDLLVEHDGARVAQVGAHARPRRDLAARHHTGFDERPRPVADRRDRLAALEELPDEGHGVRIHAQLVGVDRPAGKQQRVVLADRRCRHEGVDGERAGVVEVVVARRDLAVVDGQQLDVRTGAGQRPERLLELDALNAVRRQDRHPLAAECVGHAPAPFVVGLRPQTGPQRCNPVSGDERPSSWGVRSILG
jgi:hypothetical protein